MNKTSAILKKWLIVRILNQMQTGYTALCMGRKGGSRQENLYKGFMLLLKRTKYLLCDKNMIVK